MKKIAIATVSIVSAIVANAATVNWACPYGIANATEDGSTTATIAYLIDSAALTQSEIYTALTEGKTLADAIGDNYVKTATLSDGEMTAQKFESPFADGTKTTLYMTIFDSDLNAVYFSESIEKTMLSVGDTKYQFGADSSTGSVALNMDGFSASKGGWVSTASVPEPTSGLLMLLGMAGLALRRRRA